MVVGGEAGFILVCKGTHRSRPSYLKHGLKLLIENNASHLLVVKFNNYDNHCFVNPHWEADTSWLLSTRLLTHLLFLLVMSSSEQADDRSKQKTQERKKKTKLKGTDFTCMCECDSYQQTRRRFQRLLTRYYITAEIGFYSHLARLS